MELPAEIITEHKLEQSQIDAIKNYVVNEYVPTIKKEYDGLANTNAEKILDGAAKKAKEMFGLNIDREQGEKYGDYVSRLTEKVFEKTKLELNEKEKEIQEKLANFKGGDEFKAQLEVLKAEKDSLLKKVAELEPLQGIDVKYKEANEQLSKLKLNVAFNSVKPSFPDTANKYEVNAKWDAFKNQVLAKYNIEIIDNEPIAVDKENHHKQVKLAELLNNDKNITKLLQGRQQKGNGASSVSKINVDGVPFAIPTEASKEEINLLVREHLIKKYGDALHANYAHEFSQMLSTIYSAKKG